jgi:signal transduction histidine kinase
MKGYLRKIVLACVCSTFCFALPAQQDTVIDLANVAKFERVGNKMGYFLNQPETTQPQQLKTQKFLSAEYSTVFSVKHLNGRHFIRITVANSGAISKTFLLFLGRGIEFSFYKSTETENEIVPAESKVMLYNPVVFNNIPYQEISVNPGEKLTLYGELDVRFYNYLEFNPVIVNPSYQQEFAFFYFFQPNVLFVFIATVVLGIMLGMAIYSLMLFFQSGRLEYFYYGSSALLFIMYFALQAVAVFAFQKEFFYPLLFIYHTLELAGFGCFLLFVASFLKLKEILPDIFKLIKVVIAVEAFFLIIDSLLAFSDKLGYVSVDSFEGVRIFLLCCGAYIIFILFSSHNKLSWYVAMGGLSIAVLGAFALYLSHASIELVSAFNNIGGPTAFFMLGILFLMFFCMMGLGYKRKLNEIEKLKSIEMLKLENERQALEKFKAVIEAKDMERTRIAREIHDDIGAGLTSIRLMSELFKSKKETLVNEEIQKISVTASTLVDKMNEIIWTMNPRNDSLSNLIAYLRHLVVEYFEPMEMELHVKIPDSIPEMEITGNIRRNILLTVKEALHNIVKHSRANRVDVEIRTDGDLIVNITDNGIGFDINTISSHRNGIRNMKERLEIIGGQLFILNGNGTTVKLEVPITEENR